MSWGFVGLGQMGLPMALNLSRVAECIAFEDSAIGVRAAKSAGAWVIAVPDPTDIDDPDIATANVVLPSLSSFSMDCVG